MALRELLLAAERDRQPLDDAFLSFSRSLRLSDPADDQAPASESEAAALRDQFLAVHPQGELLLRVWPEQHGVGSRWEKRESFATFLHVVTHLLQFQTQRDAAQAEACALRVVREKAAQLEKLLSWSDKPLIEFRALQLLGQVAKVSGVTARELVRLFNFQCSAFVKLAMRRWKKPEVVEDAEEEEVKQAPFQLRAAYVDLVLALTACPDKSVHRFSMKEGGVTASLFKSMDGDSAEMLGEIFDKLGQLVLYNKEVERKSKLVVFNGMCVHQLLALLQVEDEEGVRDTALGVLNALFFEDSALYVVPQKQALRLFLSKSKASGAQDEEAITSDQAYAVKVVRNAVVTIGVNEMLRSTQAQTLVMRFLAAYPGLLSEYLAALAVQLEPKPVYRWFCVASLVQKLLACSLNAVTTGLPTTQNGEALSSWCSAQALASRLIAPGNYRKELSRSIQHNNNLVIYSSLGVIDATLKRYVRLAPSLESLGLASEVQSELRFLVPSPEALVSLLLKLCASEDRSIALVYVRALTVFRLYLECLPQTMREVKVDFTKTLAWRYLDVPAADNSDDTLPSPMQSLIVGEMLRFLLAVDTPRLGFLFTSGASGNRSRVHQMLLLYVSSPSRAVQKLAGQVLQRTLLASDIFGQETLNGRADEEVTFWLESLRQSGGRICAEFTEQITRAVMTDPLLYVAIGRRVVTDASSSLSPITVALVGFLNALTGDGTQTEKFDLSAYRADSSVVAFAVRILLGLIPTSKYPHQLVALIASNDAFTDTNGSAINQDENSGASSDDSNCKKRKRPVSSDEIEHECDAYVWLKAHCEALASGKRGSSSVSTPKKKARAASTKWYRFSDPNALTAALVAMKPDDFISSWEHVISNCADVADTFDPVLHYLSARGDVDILTLLNPASSPSAKTKQQSKVSPKSAAAEEFSKVVPAHVVLQHILFTIASKEPKQQKLAIAAVTSWVKRRVTDHRLETMSAARMCEQLLFFFSSSHLGFSDDGLAQLCELLLLLLTVVIVSGENAPAFGVLWRVFFKLRAVVSSTSNDALWRLLSAAEIVALRVYSGIKSEADVTALCDFDGMFLCAGVPLVAVLASRIPPRARTPMLDSLLSDSSTVTPHSPRLVLVERVLGSLETYSQEQEHYSSFSEYKRAKLLTRKLWQLLNSQGDQSLGRQLPFFTAGFTVLGRLGGIDAATAMASIESSLSSLVMRSARELPSANGSYCSKVLRSIVSAIRAGNDAAAFPMEFQEHLMKRLRREKDKRVQCEVVGAVYNVFALIANPVLRNFASKLALDCYGRVLLGSRKNCAPELALLRYVSVDGCGSADPEALSVSTSAIVKKLAMSESEEMLTSSQLLGLLFLLRSGSNESTALSLLLVLVRSGLLALKTTQTEKNTYESIVLMMESAVASLVQQNQEKRVIALKTVLSLYAEMREIIREAAQPAFEAFVSMTAGLLRLAGNDTSAVDYDFEAHFDVIVNHPCFVQSLQNMNNDDVRLLIVRVVARLARLTGNYTRSLLQTLLSSYSMSLSSFDRSLRVLFEEFEAHGSTMGEELTLVSMGFRFGASSTISPSATTTTGSLKRSHNDLVDDSAWVLGGGLEQNRVRVTIDHFPLDRELSTASDVSLLNLDEELSDESIANVTQTISKTHDEKESEAYDPAFLLPMLSHFISSSDLPDGGIVQQGLLGIAIRATSSDAESIREYAYGILAHLHESLQATNETTSEFKAGRQVHLLLDVFRRGVEDPLELVPSVVSVFLNDALAVLTRPTHVLYPQVNHFLLARPAMDLADVPMFYSLFNSRAPLTYRQERSWLLHTLRRGVRSDDDVALLVRRHVLPMLLSFFTSELADTHTQPLITSILLAALRTPSGGVYVVTKGTLLEWLADQFLRHGAASFLVKTRGDKSSGSMRTASSALLLPLMTLLEETMQDSVWNELDTTQQHAAALQAVNAFASLQPAIGARRSTSKSDQVIVAKVAIVAELVVRRAGAVCSLQLLQKALEVVQQPPVTGNASALDCAEMVANNLSRWLLQQNHHEALKLRFPDWASLLRQVAAILVTSKPAALTQQRRAKRALKQLKIVLDQLPTLKQLVLSADSSFAYSPALI